MQDRAYRINQQRDVTVYRLIAVGMLEELIYMRQLCAPPPSCPMRSMVPVWLSVAWYRRLSMPVQTGPFAKADCCH